MSDDKKDVQESESLNLKVLGLDRTIVQFKIKKFTPLKKLIKTYCDRAGLDETAVRFLYDGERIGLSDTPAKMKMEEGGVIDVVQEQEGGGL